jgi:hypothetical protein
MEACHKQTAGLKNKFYTSCMQIAKPTATVYRSLSTDHLRIESSISIHLTGISFSVKRIGKTIFSKRRNSGID